MTSDQNKHFDDIFQKMDRAYERYAKSCGMTYSSLALLQLIWESQPCTQKDICEVTMLPKQTVNTVVMSFYKQGFLEMLEQSEDRRHKSIILSERGKDIAAQILPKIKDAETASMEQFTEEEQSTFFRLLERFSTAFCDKLNQ